MEEFKCSKCEKVFGAPATLRIHTNHCEVVKEEKVVEKPEKKKKK